VSSAPSVIVATTEQLAEFVRDAVAAALAEQREDVSPVLMDRSGIGRALGVSPTTVDRLRREGLPCVLIGDSPRFIVASCIEWLHTNRVSRESE
jgi:hypothetical protein